MSAHSEEEARALLASTAKARAPWFAPSSCTGSCNQGRSCDCLPDVPFSTRRHPRTLNEAFGPYTSNAFHTPAPQPSLAMRIVGALCWALSAAGMLWLLLASMGVQV